MANATTSMNEEIHQLMEVLEKPEIRHSLQQLLEKLPEIQQTIESVGEVMEFGKSVLKDEKTISRYEDLVFTYNISLDTLSAVVQIIEKMPKLVHILQQLEDVMDFITAVLQDKQTTTYVINNAKEYIDPLIDNGKKGMSFIKIVQQRAEEKPQNLTVFSIIKWMKDPSVQRLLNYVQATLDILKEKNRT